MALFLPRKAVYFSWARACTGGPGARGRRARGGRREPGRLVRVRPEPAARVGGVEARAGRCPPLDPAAAGGGPGPARGRPRRLRGLDPSRSTREGAAGGRGRGVDARQEVAEELPVEQLGAVAPPPSRHRPLRRRRVSRGAAGRAASTGAGRERPFPTSAGAGVSEEVRGSPARPLGRGSRRDGAEGRAGNRGPLRVGATPPPALQGHAAIREGARARSLRRLHRHRRDPTGRDVRAQT